MKLLLVFVLLPVCCHGFWDQFYDPIKFNAPKDRTRRAAETENDLGTSDGHEIDRRYIGPPADILRSSYGNEIESGRLMSNADQKSNDTNSNDTNEDHKEHHGVHVAGWNWDYIEGPMIICIFISIVSICKLGFHHAHFLSSIVPESCLLIVLGAIFGGIFYAEGDHAPCLSLTPRLFFLFLLPPIILDSAHDLYDRTFFNNLGTILLHAVLGTLLNCFIIGPVLYGASEGDLMGSLHLTFVECLVFSALIAAVDPVAVLAIFQEIGVNDVLYFIVFGESLLNDAVTVVIYNMMQAFFEMDDIPGEQIGLGFAAFFTVSLGGLSIGIAFGILTAFVTKFTKHVRVVEPLAILILAYTSYLAAEMFHFSGIISIMGCGLTQAHYAFHNIGYKSEITVRYFTKMISGASDSIIFMYLGAALVPSCAMLHHQWNGWFIFWAIALCVVTRFMVVFSLNFIVNKARLRKLDIEEQFIMAYGGLRGAVAFSLVNMMDPNVFGHRNLFQTSTLMIILFTVFLQGLTVKPLVKLLRISRSEKDDPTMFQEIHSHVTDHMMAGVEEIVGSKGENAVRSWFGSYDKQLLRRWLQRDPYTKDEIILQAFQDIEMSSYYQHLEEKAAGGPRADVWYPSNCNPVHSGLTDVMLDLKHQSSRSRATTGLSMMSSRSRYRRMSETSSTSGASVGRLHSLFAKMMRQVSSTTETDPWEPDTTAQDLRGMLRRKESFHQRYDRNMMFQDQTDLWHRLQENATRKSRLRNTMLNNQEDYPGSGYTYETAQDLTRPGSVRRRPLLRHSTSHAGEVPAVANGVPMVPVRSRAFTEPTGVVVEPSAPPRHLENIPDEDEEQPDPGNNSNVKSGSGETRL